MPEFDLNQILTMLFYAFVAYVVVVLVFHVHHSVLLHKIHARTSSCGRPEEERRPWQERDHPDWKERERAVRGYAKEVQQGLSAY